MILKKASFLSLLIAFNKKSIFCFCFLFNSSKIEQSKSSHKEKIHSKNETKKATNETNEFKNDLNETHAFEYDDCLFLFFIFTVFSQKNEFGDILIQDELEMGNDEKVETQKSSKTDKKKEKERKQHKAKHKKRSHKETKEGESTKTKAEHRNEALASIASKYSSTLSRPKPVNSIDF